MVDAIYRKVFHKKPFWKRYRIREFSPIWWAGFLLGSAAFVASFYALYCMLWIVEQSQLG